MSHHIVGMILVYLHLTDSDEGIQILQSPAQLWLTSGQTAQMECRISKEEWTILWYKEQQNRNLHGIHQSSEFDSSKGKYSSHANGVAKTFSLMISDVQRSDSGVYYCGLSASVYLQPNFGNGTRLIVTDASEPGLSFLVPSALEGDELPHDVPLLCLLSDFTPSWSTILWNTGEGMSEGQTDAGTIDRDGIFSVWSLMTMSAERWNQQTICICMTQQSGTGRNISATVSKETGDCKIVFFIALPCIFILILIQLLILLWRKCPIRGRAVQRGNQIPMRKIPETEYATLTHSNRHAPL